MNNIKVSPEMTVPKISIIVLTYNRRELLGKCLDSLVKQSYGNFEIIVLDEYSNDGTEQIIKNMSDVYKNIRLVQRDKKGLAYGRNSGVKEAKGEIIAFIDDDEVADPDWLKRGAESLDKNNASIVLGAVYLPDGRLFKPLDPNNLVTTTANIFYIKKLIEDVGMFDEQFVYGSEDLDLGMRAIEAGYKCVICKDAITYHPDRMETPMSQIKSLWNIGRLRLPNTVLRHKKHSATSRGQLYYNVFYKRTHIIPTVMFLNLFIFTINIFTLNKPYVYYVLIGSFVTTYFIIRIFTDTCFYKYPLRVIAFPFFILFDSIEVVYTIKGAIKHRYFIL